MSYYHNNRPAFQPGYTPWSKGKCLSEETRRKMSIVQKKKNAGHVNIVECPRNQAITMSCDEYASSDSFEKSWTLEDDGFVALCQTNYFVITKKSHYAPSRRRIKIQSTQIPGTATFLNRWGDTTVAVQELTRNGSQHGNKVYGITGQLRTRAGEHRRSEKKCFLFGSRFQRTIIH